MTKAETARKHCCNWHRGACLFDKPCEPDKCSYWPVVEGTATRAGGKLKKGTVKL